MTLSLDLKNFGGEKGNFVSNSNFYCMKEETVNANPTSTFSGVKFTMECSSGAYVLSVVLSSAAAFLTYLY